MSERKRRFFLSLEAHGYEPGDTVKLGGGGWSPDDETLMDKMCAWLGVKDDKQRQKILETFASEGLLKIDTKHRLTIQPKGYEFLDSLVEVGGSGSQAFVAMWFDDSMSLAFDEGFKPAIENAGFDALRIDRKEHNNKIDDEIVGEIRRSRFVVADFTTRTEGEGSGARGGVYFEAGFAMGLGLPVIWTCREDCIGFVHFDTRQYSHVVWQEPSDLAEKLRKRILAVVGEGPEVLN
ncbi:MAG: hypothetical protein ACTS1X_09890 [Parasphingopyxis sp.]|uniref:hypothetical protein n=1 Tax=Parasphingopyxis sp. TaxID=1920299 RepID=UPI003FA0B73B